MVLNDLAHAYVALGAKSNINTAISYYQRALHIFTRSCPSHPATAQCKDSLSIAHAMLMSASLAKPLTSQGFFSNNNNQPIAPATSNTQPNAGAGPAQLSNNFNSQSSKR
jgi:hypothetical protein